MTETKKIGLNTLKCSKFMLFYNNKNFGLKIGKKALILAFFCKMQL